MVREVVEVVARFGDTILDVAHIGPTETYRIGTASDTQLAVRGITSFPLVDGNVVCCPLGMEASERGGVTELSFGALTICVGRTKLDIGPVARPRVDWRPPVFVLGSLLVHLAIWFIAMTLSPLERLAAPRAPQLRLARVESPPRPPEPKPTPRKQASASIAQPQHTSRVPRAERARGRVARSTGGYEPTMQGVGMAASAIAASFDRIHLPEKMAALDPGDAYNPEADDSPRFGGGNALDPNNREGWGTIKSGGYEIIPAGVTLCPDKSCTVQGPVPALFVRTHLHHHMDAIYDCYVRYAEGPGTIVLEFTITADGAVRDARGSGLGETGECAARVASEIFFKAFGRETHVRYPLRFKPPPY